MTMHEFYLADILTLYLSMLENLEYTDDDVAELIVRSTDENGFNIEVFESIVYYLIFAPAQ